NLQGFVQCTPRTVGWSSSRWTTEDAGSGYIRFKNVWQPNQYIHVENLQNQAQHGTIYAAWQSAQWILEPVTGARLGEGEDQAEETTVSLFPNPVTLGALKVNVPQLSGEVEIQIRNAQGLLVNKSKTQITNSGVSLNVADLKSGAYVLHIKSADKVIIRKFLVR
ncbi:MAG TPA: T9SS type A sorting domain-containing protein, partial [Cytophagales bacterium]|nr:T9SS type A sorting domain-containing protein [Cytophagales bacterium]